MASKGNAAPDTGGPASTSPKPSLQAAHQQVLEGRRKFNSHLEDHVLDYFHNNPIHIEACLSTCIKLFGNVVNDPHEEKYRKVKTGSNTLKNTVFVVKGGEDMLLLAGWHPRVLEMEKFWVFDSPPDSVRFSVLTEALHLCERAQQTVHDKAEKKRKEHEDKMSRDAAEKDRIRLAIEEDKAERKQRAEMMAAAAAAAAAASATAPATATAPVRHPAGHKLGH